MARLLRLREAWERAGMGKTKFYSSPFFRSRIVRTEAGPRVLESDVELYIRTQQR